MTGTSFDIAVVGADGLVGEAVLSLLSDRRFPAGEVYALGTGSSVVNKVAYGSRMIPVADLEGFDFSRVRIALFCAGAETVAEYAPLAISVGCLVVDSSSHFRDQAPLVVAEVNPDRIGDYAENGIVAIPAPATAQLAAVLKPIHDAATVLRVNVCTLLAVSARGNDGVKELAGQTALLLNGKPVTPSVFPKQIAFNLLPGGSGDRVDGQTRDEAEMIRELRKVLDHESLQVNPTMVQAPVFFGHSQVVHLETREKMTADEAQELLSGREGITVLDGDEEGAYPTAVTETVGSDEIFVSRIREDISHPRGLDLWIVADNVRKSTALNIVQTAEVLVKDYL
jgi:aspartate-semialdehyde dehydrogenase